MLNGAFFKHRLDFRFAAGTSRGVLRQKATWFLKIWESDKPGLIGIGECGPLAGLSPDPLEDIDNCLNRVLKVLEDAQIPRAVEEAFDLAENIVPENFPSVRFGVETALLDLLHGGTKKILTNDFWSGQLSIPINGLVWMNDKEHMIRQADEKISSGFNCIKIKIGAIDFDDELEVLEYLRANYNESLTLRVDANGAFDIDDAFEKLERLSQYNLHSIEQPLMPGYPKAMSELSIKSPVPIALDEELIGQASNKRELLTEILPQYIVLKPTLLGGLKECGEWIRISEELGIDWWLTSMLESNIGLNAIAQYAAQMAPGKIHGLGTGQLYTNNIESPLKIENGHILYLDSKNWDNTLFQET